jgi:ribosomal protein S18 acetylase RimI-like enzyme
MASATTVRTAVEADLDSLASLGEGVQRLHHEGRPDLFVPADHSVLRDFFADRLRDGSYLFLAEAHGQPVGYLFAQHVQRPESPFTHPSSVLYIHHIAVAPETQQSGVGTSLMSAASDLAHSLNVGTLRLDSWHFNESAHTFFRARGFSPMNIVFERAL